MLQTARHCLAALLTLQIALANPIKNDPPCPSTALPHGIKKAHLGAVSSESDICSRVGTELLKVGGNAADAMVGTVACVGVVGMYHSGEIAHSLIMSAFFGWVA